MSKSYIPFFLSSIMAGKVCNRCGTKNLFWNKEQHERTGKWQLEDHKNPQNDWCVISKRKVIPQKFTLIHCELCCGHFGWCDDKEDLEKHMKRVHPNGESVSELDVHMRMGKMSDTTLKNWEFDPSFYKYKHLLN